ncbi:MAG: MFS transporter [Anaerolineales bacterium]|nr:MFS transporter [Anaerolineales bacterium]
MNRDLALVAAALFAWGIGESSFFYFQPLYLEQLGASHLMIGGILSLLALGMTVTHIPAGYLADRLGRRALMHLAWLLGSLAALIMAMANNLQVFTIGALLYGVTAFVAAPMNSYISAARGQLKLNQALTITQSAYQGGAIAGPLIGGLIGARLGLRQIYWFAAAAFLLSTLVILLIRTQPVEKRSALANRGLFLNRRYLAFLPIIFLAMFAMYLPQPLTPNFLQLERAVSVSTMGLLGTLGSAGNLLLTLTLGQLQPLLGFILGQVAVAGSALLIWQGNGPLWYGAAYLLLGGYRAARMLSIAQVRSLVTAANMGLAFGIADTAGGLGVILAPFAAGYLFERNPILIYNSAASALGLAIFISLIYFARTKNHLERIHS